MSLKSCIIYAAATGATLLFGFLVFDAGSPQRALAQQAQPQAPATALDSLHAYGETN